MNGELLHVQELKMYPISPQEIELHLSHSDSLALLDVGEEGALKFPDFIVVLSDGNEIRLLLG